MSKFILSDFSAKAFRVLLVAGLLFTGFVQAKSSPQDLKGEPVQEGQSQEDQTLNSGYSLRVYSQIVVLDVSVIDAKGEPVRGLTKDDFTILEDGKPQPALTFEATKPEAERQGVLTSIRSTAELDQKYPESPVSIIVLDELTSKFEDQYFARYSLEKYLGRQGEVLNQPMMLVARTLDRMMVLCDYTTSKKEILEAIRHHFVGNDWLVKNPDRMQEKVGAVFASLLELAKATQGHPGHKNLVWIGRGFPAVHWENLNSDQMEYYKSSLASCVNLLRDARMTLYVLDPGGIASPQLALDANGNVSIEDPFGGEVNLDAMAYATGGQSLHGRNDVDRMISTAIHNGEEFYTLAYRPSKSENENPKEFRSIKVVLKNKQLSAIHRAGYYPMALPPPPSLRDSQGQFSQLPEEPV